MKIFVIHTLLCLTLTLHCKAGGDTLLINLKSGAVEKIALSDIQQIKFENITEVHERTEQASNLSIKGNYPNPFSEQTNIEFEIETQGNVIIIIYDASGSEIQKLEYDNCQSGKNTLPWNCIDKNSHRVQSGTYFYEIRFNNEFQSRKMILIN